jgi:hypothetical protein
LLVELALRAEHRRGRGAMYDALNSGRVELACVRRPPRSLPLKGRRISSPWTSARGYVPTPDQ